MGSIGGYIIDGFEGAKKGVIAGASIGNPITGFEMMATIPFNLRPEPSFMANPFATRFERMVERLPREKLDKISDNIMKNMSTFFAKNSEYNSNLRKIKLEKQRALNVSIVEKRIQKNI